MATTKVRAKAKASTKSRTTGIKKQSTKTHSTKGRAAAITVKSHGRPMTTTSPTESALRGSLRDLRSRLV